MRVRPLRPTERRQPRTERRPHVLGRPESESGSEPEAAQPEVVAEHPAERRHRESVASEDTAHYACSCGFQFQAPVTTSVGCPHCGASQAW
jgi:hypothetical protein